MKFSFYYAIEQITELMRFTLNGKNLSITCCFMSVREKLWVILLFLQLNEVLLLNNIFSECLI